MRFVVYKGEDGWRWRAVAANGKKTASSHEVFASKRNAVRACDAFIYSVLSAVWVVEVEP
jgi:uncharacterized protein YegP (UPF0339 family)